MKRLSLISLLWLVAVVAAFFGGRASNERKVTEPNERHRAIERMLLDQMGYVLHTDEFAESLPRKLAEIGIDCDKGCTTKALHLEPVISLTRLAVIHPASRADPFTTYVVSPSYVIQVDYVPPHSILAPVINRITVIDLGEGRALARVIDNALTRRAEWIEKNKMFKQPSLLREEPRIR